jgi:hypothetical protein
MEFATFTSGPTDGRTRWLGPSGEPLVPMGPVGAHRSCAPTRLFLGFEVSQIRHRLVLLGRYQEIVATDKSSVTA